MPDISTLPPVTEADEWWVFMPSTCRQCPASGCGPVYDSVEEPHTLAVRPGDRTIRCEYRCRVCACEWTDRWPFWGLFGPGEMTS